ncbi:MAG: metallophosphoesterase [Nitrospirae bacterium]|nr:metallophosphoesterase [Nitrospirota bacterium]
MLFIATFFLIYGGLHLYAFLKARSAFAFGAQFSLFLILFMLLMTLAPFIVNLSEKYGLHSFARFMSYTGYLWMGALFLFFSYSLLIDLYRLLVYAAKFVFKNDLSYLTPTAGFCFFVPLILSLSTSLYGYFEAGNIRTEKITIMTALLPKDISSLKIVQISDVHIGLIVREERLNKILNKVKEADPDIMVSTGDLVDGQINSLSGLSGLFREINPGYGKYAITGNHEFYAGIDQSMEFINNSGFKVLRGEGLTVAGLINIAGVDDPAGGNYGSSKKISEKELLSSLPRDKFTLLLKHRPAVDKDSPGLFDLQLSGHTHRGQVFPFSLITMLYYPVASGFARLSDNAALYVSRGSGTWGPPMPVLSPPEITVIEIVHDVAH